MHQRQQFSVAQKALHSLCAMSLLACGTALADQRVGSGSVSSMANGHFDLACTNIVVAGTLDVDQGTYVGVGNVHVLAGGILNGGSGSIALAGTFIVDAGGQFNRQGLTLQGDSLCVRAASIAAPVPALQMRSLPILAGLLMAAAWLRLRNLRAPRRRFTSNGTDTQ
ncbi:MAG: hypothetical protein ABI190_03050 [Casimicrobiaceae bacterium]